MENEPLNLARDFINNTNRSVFLTGKAGTGKTTFLRQLQADTVKRVVVVAPTGIAAINARGVTIHSFFQMPFGPILPDTELSSPGFNRKFSKTKINIIRSMDVLIIDEISMVRADLLDGIDRVLRRYRDRNRVFGGVQLLMIGDLQQLSPVIKPQEWELLKSVYENGFFFSSRAYQACQAICVELKHIYRQSDETFISILNEVRNDNLSAASEEILNRHYQPDFTPDPSEGYITLTTHNIKAKAINNHELKKLKEKPQRYTAQIDGKFPEHSYPNTPVLELKVGAQVMFIKNDSSYEKRYFNGKIGKVIFLDDDEVVVHCPEDDENIIATAETWDHLTYDIDPETKTITEKKLGSYSQIPLRLAWAITIHKSQGLTFEKAIIDAQGAFAHGQTYVALSRCKSLQGLVLKNRIGTNQIISNTEVQSFHTKAEADPPNATILKNSQRNYQLELIAEIFDFYAFLHPVNRILDIFYKNKTSVLGNLEIPLLQVKEAVSMLLKVNTQFKNHLAKQIPPEALPENSEIVAERFKKALGYFEKVTEKQIVSGLSDFNFSTDNKTISKDILKQFETLETALAKKRLFFKNLTHGFDTLKVLKLRSETVFISEEKTKKSPKRTLPANNTHPLLFESLQSLRSSLAESKGVSHYAVFTQKTLQELCAVLPITKQALLAIHGMGKKRLENYGDEILSTIQKYCEKQGEVGHSTGKTLVKKTEKESSNSISLKLFKSGKKIDEIAKERHLKDSTIFNHLLHFLPTGEVAATDLIAQDRLGILRKKVSKTSFETLSELKEKLNHEYSYPELQLVLRVLRD